MKISDIISGLDLELYAGHKGNDRLVTGGYTGDLLSDVMAKTREGDLWITIQTHINIVAVADLKDLSGIIVVNNNIPAKETLDKCNELGIALMGTSCNAFEISGRLYTELKK